MRDLCFSLECVMEQFVLSNVKVLGIASKGSGGFEHNNACPVTLSVGNELYRSKSFKHLGSPFSFYNPAANNYYAANYNFLKILPN